MCERINVCVDLIEWEFLLHSLVMCLLYDFAVSGFVFSSVCSGALYSITRVDEKKTDTSLLFSLSVCYKPQDSFCITGTLLLLYLVIVIYSTYVQYHSVATVYCIQVKCVIQNTFYFFGDDGYVLYQHENFRPFVPNL